MNLKEQQYICVLADCANITRASEKLFISQPALSIYINNLEKTLGVKLFDRIGKKFVLTAAGEIYVEKARQMLALQTEFEQELNDLKNNCIGTIACGVQIRRAPFLLPPVMARFHHEYPNIKITLKEGERTDLESYLTENQIQILIDNLENPRDDLINIPLYQDRPLIALPVHHPLNNATVHVEGQLYRHLDLSLCRDEFFILPTSRQSLRFYIDRVFSNYRITAPNYMEIRNFETAMQLVAEGYGIGFSREQFTKSMHYPKKVNFYTFGNGNEGITQVYAVYQKGRYMPDYTMRFIELLVQQGKNET